LPSTPPVFVNAYVIVHAVWKRLLGPPGDVCAGEENAGGAEEVEVALPEWVAVLFAVAVGVAVAFCAAELVAFADGEEALCAAEDAGAGVEDAWPRTDETAGFGAEAAAEADAETLAARFWLFWPWV
jgi:hypothetical protein